MKTRSGFPSKLPRRLSGLRSPDSSLAALPAAQWRPECAGPIAARLSLAPSLRETTCAAGAGAQRGGGGPGGRVARSTSRRAATRSGFPSKLPRRCAWAGTDPLYVGYHDAEWGVPVRDDRVLFEFLILEGFQAGLSWITILRKREAFRRAFDEFDAAKIACYGARDRARLMNDEGIVRNRAKIAAASGNAKAFLDVRRERGSFASYLWDFVGGRPIRNRFRTLADVPAETDESRALSKDLRARGFNFVGPTICYAFMQATGMVNDHVVSCFRHAEIAKLG